MTDAQRIKFEENLTAYFGMIKKELNGETLENTDKMNLWAKNLCDRYKHTQRGVNPRHHLPQEHTDTLTKKLTEEGLTIDEFIETSGKIKKVAKLLGEKSENKPIEESKAENDTTSTKTEDKTTSIVNLEDYSIEELEKMKDEITKEIATLNQKYTLKYKNLYSLTDKKYEEIGKRLEIAKSSRRRINEIIKNKTKTVEQDIQLELPEEPEIIEIIEIPENAELPTFPEQTELVIVPEQTLVRKNPNVRKQKNANEKITELIKDNEEKKAELEKLKTELEQIKQTKQDEILKYQGDYERRLAERTEELKAEYQSDFERKTAMFEIESNRKVKEANEKLEQQKQAFENYKINREKELDRQRRIQVNLEKQTKERQQQMIVKLLCSADDVSLDAIRNCLEKEKIGAEGLENNLKELRHMIPGITRVLTNEEDGTAYSLRTDAIKRLEEYKKDIVCPRISYVHDGKVEFVVRSDLHLDMTNSEDTIKNKLEMYFNYSAAHGNIPIVDLGDLAETLAGIRHKEWKKFNKEAAKLSYKFYKNYARAIASAPEIKHYTLLGNHDEHPYLVGVDPIEILSEYSDNFRALGVSKGSFKIGNDKIGVFHDKNWQNIVAFSEYKKEERDRIIYDYVCDEVEKIASNYIYSLIGHYHFGTHNIEKHFSIINNGLGSGLVFTAEVKDGHVERMFMTELTCKNYQTEIYNRGNQYRK